MNDVGVDRWLWGRSQNPNPNNEHGTHRNCECHLSRPITTGHAHDPSRYTAEKNPGSKWYRACEQAEARLREPKRQKLPTKDGARK
jgi:hypothetical protein